MARVTTDWVYVTPEKAAAILEMNTRNRPIRPLHLQRMVADMEAGRWVETHQGIAVAEDGTLLDGQHRLLAIVASGATIHMPVTLGLPLAAQAEMDGAAVRAASDFMGGSYAYQRAAALRVLLAIRALNGKVTPSGLHKAGGVVTRAEIHAADQTALGRRVSDLSQKAAAATRSTPVVGPSSLLAASALWPDDAHAFLDGIISMEGLTGGDPRRALIRFRGGNNAGRLQTPTATLAAIKAARAWAAGKDLGNIRVSKAEVVRVPTP